MNKIFNINLGGYPFTVDEDAYARLSGYLKTIERHFSSSEGYEDIIGDIESRIAELFNEQLKGQPIVSTREVEHAIKVMGTPEEFGADDFEETKSTFARTIGKSNYKVGRRLFRDTDAKVVGGVCSGLAAYFGIPDPVWLRIIAVILFFFSGGSILLVYFILWAVVPEAKTSGDKLSMRGEPINVSNIAKTVEDELDTLSDTLTDLSNEFRSKKKVLESHRFQRIVPLRRGFQL
jgi:phage shock protein PspC (stress-responsive transcriptional regulator)